MVLSCKQLHIDEKLQQKELNTEDIHFLMTKHTQQLQKMQQMIVDQRIGLIQLKAHPFYDASVPYPKEVIAAIAKYLPPVAIEKNERIQKTIRVNFICLFVCSFLF